MPLRCFPISLIRMSARLTGQLIDSDCFICHFSNEVFSRKFTAFNFHTCTCLSPVHTGWQHTITKMKLADWLTGCLLTPVDYWASTKQQPTPKTSADSLKKNVFKFFFPISDHKRLLWSLFFLLSHSIHLFFVLRALVNYMWSSSREKNLLFFHVVDSKWLCLLFVNSSRIISPQRNMCKTSR